VTTLLFDLGNTRLKWGYLDDGRVVEGDALTHHGAIDHELLAARLKGPKPDQVVCAAVAIEPLVVGLSDWLDTTWSISPTWAASQARGLGLVNSYANPARMGVDRWLAMAGARARCEGAFCVIDAGTAITVDQVDGDGVHLGGWIAPGIDLMKRSLYGGTGGVPAELAETDSTWGRSTAEAVAGGVGNAMAGLLDRAASEARELHGCDPSYWVTGGNARHVLQYLEPAATLAPDLVLEGLARWVGQNRGQC
jgi:type III pantothenate kinase